MRFIDLDQNSEKWELWRRDKIGASDLPVIMGDSPYSTPHELWSQKVGFTIRESNANMRFGKLKEAAIRHRINSEHFTKFKPIVVQNDKEGEEWQIASLDGYDREKNVVLEIKCANAEDHECATNCEVPKKYRAQLQWQLYLAGSELAWYASFHKDTLEIIHVLYDKDYVESQLIPKAKEFHEYVVSLQEPPLSERDYVQIDSIEAISLSYQFEQVRGKYEYYKKEYDRLKEELIALTDDGNCQIGSLRLTRTNRQGSIDWKQLWEELRIKFPEAAILFDPETYRKEQIGYWRID
jgi:putative phage-type endonuclease